MATNGKKMGRRTMALIWLVAASIVIGALVAFEQIALLYALATVALVVLLVVVAFADLEQVGKDGAGGFGSGQD
jgi:hypothetical protein